MSFLFPAALAMDVAVAIPLLLHLRRTPTERRIAFPAVRYLRQAERSRSRALRLRDLLLMALRTGAIALTALAAAGPLVGRGGPGEHPPTDVAIILDNSASTRRSARRSHWACRPPKRQPAYVARVRPTGSGTYRSPWNGPSEACPRGIGNGKRTC